ncbi:MAG: hypothetical protein ABSE85_01450 [Candidatus Korobacteraceae bacterium]
MKPRIVLLSMFALLCLTVADVTATASTVYDNGPKKGNIDAWGVQGHFWISDTFTVSTGSPTINGMSIWIWNFPTDHNPAVEVTITSQPNSGTVYFDQVIQFSESNCYADGFGYSICQETGSWNNGPALPAGTYWVTLKNGSFPSGDAILWDQNSGVGCNSPGCPSQAENSSGTIPSETFTILGTSGGNNGLTPKTTSLLIFGAGFVGLVGIVRHKLG